jgi:hypothetical protein
MEVKPRMVVGPAATRCVPLEGMAFDSPDFRRDDCPVQLLDGSLAPSVSRIGGGYRLAALVCKTGSLMTLGVRLPPDPRMARALS